MAWEENSCICLNMQLIAILSRIGVIYAHCHQLFEPRWVAKKRRAIPAYYLNQQVCIGAFFSFSLYSASFIYSVCKNKEKNENKG